MVIVGAGISGLSIAYQLVARRISNKIAIIEKEIGAGRHTSGRNSGVLHAGIYYKPETLKAKVCIKGAKRLKQWITERELPYNKCGKIIVPTKQEQDEQLDILFDRGKQNGAEVELWNSNQLASAAPYTKSISGRALWSPNTTVTNPKAVIEQLKLELEQKGIIFYFEEDKWIHLDNKSEIRLSTGQSIHYGHLFNCAGLYADKIAHANKVGMNYFILPFKGLYWNIKKSSKIQPDINIYPVPDLNVPFLGVHFTPGSDQEQLCTIGPTATPSLGRENYRGLQGLQLDVAMRSMSTLLSQYWLNNGGFRRYAHEQALQSLTPLMLRSAKRLIPGILSKDIELSNKVAIRPQLFNKETQRLEDDFLCINKGNTTHALNTISPAFTASFELGDLIIDSTNL